VRARLADEAGVAGGFEVLPFGLLVLVVGTLLLVNAWAVVDSNLAAGAAAREAVRAVVEGDGTAGSMADAESVAAEALAGQGKDPARMALTWSGGVSRCAPVTATVSYRVPLVAVPWVRAFSVGELTTRARHTEVVDPYRGGLVVGGFTPERCHG
jgi:hypothetical protein